MQYPPELVVTLTTLVVVAVTVVFHYEVIQLLDRWCTRKERQPHIAFKNRPTILAVMFTLLLAHVFEIWLFGLAFWLLLQEGQHGAIVGYSDINLLDCVYFSAATYTTVGWGEMYATGNIRFLAGTEALLGFMIITWSASFGYLIMQRTFGRNADY
ncbi:ion channel [Halopseudomonas salegens]|uniref:Ion channel n=1 Tax=Halopseudomonas salegens TaxID=1434072 RepID=A0A1H2HY78_9GAMM|nr:ion channel [Halopseudomonas salegens]SDU36646.1 Ion channel [Halopseudomonas salegens]